MTVQGPTWSGADMDSAYTVHKKLYRGRRSRAPRILYFRGRGTWYCRKLAGCRAPLGV